jgi:hypothetical protein
VIVIMHQTTQSCSSGHYHRLLIILSQCQPVIETRHTVERSYVFKKFQVTGGNGGDATAPVVSFLLLLLLIYSLLSSSSALYWFLFLLTHHPFFSFITKIAFCSLQLTIQISPSTDGRYKQPGQNKIVTTQRCTITYLSGDLCGSSHLGFSH